MAEVVQLAKPGGSPQHVGGFVMTDAAQDMLRSLQLISEELGGAITMIAAAPGMGKTETLRHFKWGRPQTIFHTAIAGEGTPWGVACQLMECLDLGEPNSRNLLASRRRIAEEIGVDGILLVDEAQYLIQRNTRGADNFDALEWLRAMSEEGCFSLAFCGDLALLEVEKKLPQLWRRMRRRVILRHAAKADVVALAAGRGIHDPATIEALYQVARRGGAFGDVENVIKHARLFAGNGAIQGAHVLAAIEDLHLHRMEGK